VVDTVFPLADAAVAHHRMEEAEQFGKIILGIA
jgi:NADPH:quinone reductase-like Zn-dependent oxidoreductase